ncbi:MAG: dihydrolipoamide acetyltransferase family protein [Anaerolineales bacterium]
MADVVNMPKLGFDMQEGTFAAWTKNVGDKIASGDVIAEVETDKATVEVETYLDGTLLHVLAEPGDILEVGAPIAIVGAEGEDYQGLLDQIAAGGGVSAPAEEPVQEEEAQPAAESAAGGAPAPRSEPQRPAPADNGGRVKASPVARRIASEKGINLHYVTGSGPGGRIVKQDVESFDPAQMPSGAGMAAPSANGGGLGPAPSYSVLDVPHETIDLSKLRKTIASRMVNSKQHVPHFTVTTAMRIDDLLALRKQLNDGVDDEHKITVNDLVVKATALALREYPNLNTHWHGDKLIRYQDINIGIAVALEGGGLINVVARKADSTALGTMAAKNKKMIKAARDGKVRPEDIEGSTFTVSNLGPFGVEHFTAIINPPEAGILAIGAGQKTPVVNADGEMSIATIMKVTISVDHRTSDGAEGAEYLQYVKTLIENPMRLLV